MQKWQDKTISVHSVKFACRLTKFVMESLTVLMDQMSFAVTGVLQKVLQDTTLWRQSNHYTTFLCALIAYSKISTFAFKDLHQGNRDKNTTNLFFCRGVRKIVDNAFLSSGIAMEILIVPKGQMSKTAPATHLTCWVAKQIKITPFVCLKAGHVKCLSHAHSWTARAVSNILIIYLCAMKITSYVMLTKYASWNTEYVMEHLTVKEGRMNYFVKVNKNTFVWTNMNTTADILSFCVNNNLTTSVFLQYLWLFSL